MTEGDTLGTNGGGCGRTGACVASGNDVEGDRVPLLTCGGTGERAMVELEGVGVTVWVPWLGGWLDRPPGLSH